MNNGIKLQLISAEHGFDDYDVTGHEDIHRVCVGQALKQGDIFNVYGPESTKRGATWQGSVEKSLSSFLLVNVDAISVSRELKCSHEAFKGDALNGEGEAWGVRDATSVVYETMFCESTARRLAQLTSQYPEEDWNSISARLESEGCDLSDPGTQSNTQRATQDGQPRRPQA